MQMHIDYTVVYSVFILGKQSNVIVEFTSVSFTFLSIFKFLSILRFQLPKLFFRKQIGLNLVEKIKQ